MTCWKTPCTPQKHPPATTATSEVGPSDDACSSSAGAGTTRASWAVERNAVSPDPATITSAVTNRADRRWLLRSEGAGDEVIGLSRFSDKCARESQCQDRRTGLA